MFAIIFRNDSGRCAMMAAGALCLALIAGCTSTSSQQKGVKSVDVTMTLRGSVLIDGNIVPLRRLPNALKSRGATSRTAIRIVVPDNVSEEAVRNISETLVSSGYPRMIFSKPLKASAVKKERL